jgi:hypothetical protein
MKTSRDATTKQSKQTNTRIPKPEIRDNLDSRKNEEQDDKGDDTTHNRKEVKSEKKKV